MISRDHDHGAVAAGHHRPLAIVQACLAEHFDVEHSTFQVEPLTHAHHEHATNA
jgi:cobalt-zinc-cadmium efflux system protein